MSQLKHLRGTTQGVALESAIKLMNEQPVTCPAFEARDDDTIEDGFGMVWSAWCRMCGRKSMHVCRPGKAQCGYCG